MYSLSALYPHVCHKVPYWLQWRGPNSPPKVPLPVDQSLNPTICLIPGPVRPMMPNNIRIRSAVFPQCTGQTDAPTDRRTDRPRESLITIGHCAMRMCHVEQFVSGQPGLRFCRQKPVSVRHEV